MFTCSVMSDSLQLHGLQHTRLPSPSLSSGICSNSCPLSRWCYLTILSSVTSFSFCPQFSQHQGLFQWVGSLHLNSTKVKWSESRSVVSNSLRSHGLYSPWNSPGQNIGVGSLSLLQGIFPTQGSTPGLLHYRWILYQLSHKGSPIQPKDTPFPVLNQSIVPCPVLTVACWPAYRFLRRQIRWFGIPISSSIFHNLLWSTQKSFK